MTCANLAFTAPTDMQALSASDDSSGDACGNGFQYNIVASIRAQDGTAASLIGTNGATTTTLGMTQTSGGVARFPSVLLPTGATTLSINLGTLGVCPTTATVNVDCTRPSVKILSPQADPTATLPDVSKHLLAATSTQAFKDSVPASAGAQTTVIACTNRIGSATLVGGLKGAILTAIGATVNSAAAVPTDNCPSGLPFVVRFVNVTLPESTENGDGTLNTATEIRVDIVDAAITTATGSSVATDLWVDSVAPTISENSPAPLCGSGMPAATATITTPIAFNSSTGGVQLAVTNSGATTTLITPAYAANVATFANVPLPLGLNTLLATAIEPSGNRTDLAPPSPATTCTYAVGDVPVVTFLSPPANAKLCASTNNSGTCTVDTNTGLPGWQGSLIVRVTVGGAPVTTGENVTFQIGTATPQTIPIDGGGLATLSAASIPEGTAVAVTATTDNIAGKGTGVATSSYLVDTVAPAAATGLFATVIDRRQTSFSLDWSAPSDAGVAVAAYDIRVKTFNETTMTCGTDIRTIPYTGTPKAPGLAENLSIPNLFIENHYCFTITPSDAAGNIGPTASTDAIANFNKTTLTSPVPLELESFGVSTDGTGDFGKPGAGGFANDRLSDLLVGTNTGKSAYLFFGRTGGYPTTADVVFTGPANRLFGYAVAAAGDLDGDGLTDIAISATGSTTPSTVIPAVYIFSRKNATWAVGGGWPATLDYTQASYVITADASYIQGLFGVFLTRVGDFDGGGADDLMISAPAYPYSLPTGNGPGRVIIVKGSTTFTSFSLPDTTRTITIDGETAGDQFGRGAQALPDGTIVVAAWRASAAAGKVYAFRWPLAPTVVAGVMSAYDVTTYGTASGRYGLTLATLGPLGPSLGVVAISAPNADVGSKTGAGFVDVHMVPASDGIFGGVSGSTATPTVHFTSSTTGNSLGLINIGSQVSGSSIAGSLIGGDSIPDLVLAGQAETTSSVFIVSGAALTSMAGTVDLSTVPSPSVIAIKSAIPWSNYGRTSGLVLDLNGDGYSDFALSEQVFNGIGRTLVFW